MCRKLICLVSLVFVLGSVWTSPAEAADPNLVGWWKFDGDGLDASGNSRNGTLAGNAHYEAGHSGQALALDGDGDYFTVTGYKGLMSTSAVTVTAWVKTTASGDATMVYWGRNSGGRRVDFRLGSGRLRVEHGNGNLQGDTAVNDGEWHHIALTMPAAAQLSYPYVKFYRDGRDDTRISTDPDAFNLTDNASNVDLTFGYRVPNVDRYFPGLLDDVQIYNRELTGVEISDLATLGYLASPHSPNPADGATIEDTWKTLTWTAGPLATSHNVYFSTSYDDVAAGADAAFVGNVATNSQPVGFPGFPAPGGLVLGTTYYWRVDEINPTHPGSPWRGQVWSFTVPPTMAYKPDPGDGEPAEFVNADLHWSPGMKTIMNAVYFGTNRDQVANGVGTPPYLSTTYDPGALTNSTTYYWRVDTFNGAAWITGPVWTFTTMPVIPLVADPNLVAWWKLDEGAGTHAIDWSGHGHHGTLQGDVLQVDGYDGGALQFDGSGDYVTMDGYKGILGTRARTVTAWVKTTSTATGEIVGWGPNVASQRMELRIDAGRLRGEHQGGNVQGSTNLTDGGWHHVAVTLRENITVSYPDVKLYLDGVDDTIPTTDPDAFNTVAGNDVRIGSRPSNNDRFFTGLIDDVRIYDKELTQQELELVMRIDLLPAWRPGPKDGATPDIEHATPLAWTRGDKATQHEVYFGTDRTAVANAGASDTTGIYRGRQIAASFTPAAGLAWGGGPYFWRVDENNNDGTVTKGKIWSFTVGDFLVVDDIESYNDLAETDPASKRIYLSWIDGFGTTTNGALVSNANVPLTERANVHGGGQAMPLSYDNNLKFSEATLTLKAGNDWTRQGVTELSLWFRGLATNAAEKMYVALNGTAVVYHTDPNVAKTTAWTEWVIPLQQFAALGVNLNNVTSVTIGFGTRGSTVLPGGTGQMYFDDIKLRRTPVVPVVATVPLETYDPTSVSAVPAP
jgi:hypothetical protein